MQIIRYSFWRVSTSVKGASLRTVEFLVRPSLIRLCWYLLLVLLPFGTRVLVTYVTKGFHEYESLFLYGNDLFLGLLLLLAFAFHRHRVGEWHERSLKLLAGPLLIFVVVAGVSVAFAPSYLHELS